MTTPLDEKAVAAAHEAYAKTTGGMLDGQPMENAIRAYLSTTPAPDGLTVVAWECTDLIMGFGAPSVITDVDHAGARKRQPNAWLVEELVRLSQAQSALAAVRGEMVQLSAENEAMAKDAQNAWAKHGGTEIALGQWKARAETAEAEVKRLTEANEQLTQLMLTADRFNVGELDGCPVHVVTRGPNQWAISDGGFVLNDSNEWEREPMPSNRSDAFIARTRFPFAEAIRRARATLNSREKVE